jgi:hypothetical protein
MPDLSVSKQIVAAVKVNKKTALYRYLTVVKATKV